MSDLKGSITSFEKMMKANPIIVDENKTILSGNQRYHALKELKYKEIPEDWIKVIDYFNEDEKKEFIVKMNTHAGEFDFEQFANDDYWSDVNIGDWIDFVPEQPRIDLAKFFHKVDPNADKAKEKKIPLILSYEESTYMRILELLEGYDEKNEDVILRLLIGDIEE